MTAAVLIATYTDGLGHPAELYYPGPGSHIWYTTTTWPSGGVSTVSVSSYRARELYLAAEEAGTVCAPWPP